MSRAHIFFYEHFSFLHSESACHLSKKSYFYFLELQLDLWFYILDKSLDIYLKGYSAAAFSKVKTSCIIVPIKFFQDVFANYVGGWCGQNLTSRDAASCPRERIGSSLKYIENWIYPFRAWDMYCYVFSASIGWLIDAQGASLQWSKMLKTVTNSRYLLRQVLDVKTWPSLWDLYLYLPRQSLK